MMLQGTKSPLQPARFTGHPPMGIGLVEQSICKLGIPLLLECCIKYINLIMLFFFLFCTWTGSARSYSMGHCLWHSTGGVLKGPLTRYISSAEVPGKM